MIKHALVCLWMLLTVTGVASAAEATIVQQMKSGGHLLLLRHAYAPGSGDPADFKIDDCATQRNLNAKGRDQARQIGQWLRDRGIERARIYSSQWCRCQETARLLNFGNVTQLPALNSFFSRPEDRAPNMAALRHFLARQPADGPLIILVTHYVNISALTGEAVGSAEGVVVQLHGDGGVRLRGRLDFGL